VFTLSQSLGDERKVDEGGEHDIQLVEAREDPSKLFAALNAASGEIVAECAPRQRHQEFLRFARKVVRQVDPGLEIHFNSWTTPPCTGRRR
jgi:hypothetical protein